MHLETAEEGPTNQVLQTHKIISRAKSIAVESFSFLFCCYFAAVWLLYLFMFTYWCIKPEFTIFKSRKSGIAHELLV